MKVSINNEQQQLSFKGTAGQLLKKLDIRREEVVVKINGELSPETCELSDSDKVEIIKVVFGG